MSARLIVAAVLVVWLLAGAPAAHAQQEPATPELDLSALLANPGKWATTLFNAALIGVGQQATLDVADFMGWLLGGNNLISSTPPGLSFENGSVREMWDKLRLVANAGLAVVTVWGGVNLMIQPHLRAPYHGALELLPRVLIGGLLVNTSLDWGRFAIQANNALCAAIGAPTFPGWDSLMAPDPNTMLVNLIASLVYLLMGVLLLIQMLMRLALLDVLLIVAPLALVGWVVPQTYGWARLWFQTFFSTVFVQFVQVVVLQLGSDLVGGLARLVPALQSDPLNGGRAWLASLLLGVAVLQLTRTVPRLMPGYPGGGGGWGPVASFAARRLGTALGRGAGRG